MRKGASQTRWPRKAESKGEEKCILVNISGHAFLDIEAYRSKLLTQ